MLKQAGGALLPLDDISAEQLTSLKTGESYEVEIKQSRNPAFHRKVFAFFNFCFDYWRGENNNLSTSKQFDVFRANLTVLAGYYDSLYNIKGEVRIEAKSLSFGAMSQQEFEEFYFAVTNAAMKHIFKTADQKVYNQLISFF